MSGFAGGLASGLSGMPGVVAHNQEMGQRRELGLAMAGQMEGAFDSKKALAMAAVMAQAGKIPEAMSLMGTASQLERQARLDQRQLGEDEWNKELRERQRMDWTRGDEKFDIEQQATEIRKALAGLHALRPGEAGEAITDIYNKHIPDGRQGKVKGYNPETREYTFENDAGETWVATRAEALKQGLAVADPGRLLEMKQQAEAAKAKREQTLTDDKTKHARAVELEVIKQRGRQGMIPATDAAGNILRDANGGIIFVQGGGISGAKGSGGANHTAVKNAATASQEIINGYPPGKKLTPDERKQFDALLGTVNVLRVAAGLDPFTTDIQENQRIWRQDQHVIQEYKTGSPEATGDETGGNSFADEFFREVLPRRTPRTGWGLAATDYVTRRPETGRGLTATDSVTEMPPPATPQAEQDANNERPLGYRARVAAARPMLLQLEAAQIPRDQQRELNAIIRKLRVGRELTPEEQSFAQQILQQTEPPPDYVTERPPSATPQAEQEAPPDRERWGLTPRPGTLGAKDMEMFRDLADKGRRIIGGVADAQRANNERLREDRERVAARRAMLAQLEAARRNVHIDQRRELNAIIRKLQVGQELTPAEQSFAQQILQQ